MRTRHHCRRGAQQPAAHPCELHTPLQASHLIRSTRIGEACKAYLRQHSIMRLAHTSRIGHDDDAMPPGHSQNLPSAFICVERQFRLRSKADSAVRLKEDAILLSDICLQHLWLHLHSHGVLGQCIHTKRRFDQPGMLQDNLSPADCNCSYNRELAAAAGHPSSNYSLTSSHSHTERKPRLCAVPLYCCAT
jgi:hypothetical protein